MPYYYFFLWSIISKICFVITIIIVSMFIVGMFAGPLRGVCYFHMQVPTHIQKHLKMWYFYYIINCLYVLIVSRTCSIVAWMSRNFLLKTGATSEVLSDCSATGTHNYLVRKQTLNHLAKLASSNVECGAKNLVLIPVYSCFYAVIKIILFSFRICMNVNNWARLLSYVISNFVMKDIFVEQFFV